MSTSWRQLAAIPDSAMKQRILRALDITVPPEGIASSFQDAGLFITRVEGGFSFMDARHPEATERNSARLLATPIEVVRACRWAVGTPTGEAIRNWLVGHGLVRPGQAPVEPTTATRTII